jgi:hypothetical protein
MTQVVAFSKVEIVVSESEKDFTDKLQKSINEGWKPVWESFRVNVVLPPLRGVTSTKTHYAILLNK